jgi:fatty aldehyde-generating acyl-ACP reductase
MPFMSSSPPWFAFLVHPRDMYDLHVASGGRLIAEHSQSEDEFREKMLSLPPTIVGEITFGFSPARGELMAVMCMPDRIMHLPGRRQIVEAVRIAAGRGAAVVGLGALTAPATRGGLALLPDLPPRVTITTGNAFTAAVARQSVLEAAAALGLDRRARVAVVGCTGSVGCAASRLLAAAGFELVLIGRSTSRVERELPDLAPRFAVSGYPGDVRWADVVLLLTGEQSARLTPAGPRPGAVVIDFAQPPNIDTERYGSFSVHGIRVVQGGLVAIPGYRCDVDLRFPDNRTTLACLAETYLFAREGIREHSVGAATVELAQELERVAVRHGVRMRPLGLVASEPAAVRAASA